MNVGQQICCMYKTGKQNREIRYTFYNDYKYIFITFYKDLETVIKAIFNN